MKPWMEDKRTSRPRRSLLAGEEAKRDLGRGRECTTHISEGTFVSARFLFHVAVIDVPALDMSRGIQKG